MYSFTLMKKLSTLSATARTIAVAMERKAELTEQIVKKEIAYEEVQSFTEIKASKTQITINQGQTVTLRANIPQASDVKWILNGAELSNSENYRYGVSGNDHTLTIKTISSHDQGILTCEAKTEHGVVKCQFDMTISAIRSDAPDFVVQPRSQNVNEGQNVTFTCEITGEPSPEIEWLKDNAVVSSLSLYFGGGNQKQFICFSLIGVCLHVYMSFHPCRYPLHQT